MSIGLARTSAEAHLYMELHPCPQCGDTVFRPASTVVRTPRGTLASRYAGPCPGCGTEREFEFDLPGQTLFPPASGVRFGAADASRIIDAGEWLFVADLVLGDLPAEPDGRAPADERAAAARDAALGLAAVEEVLKFIPAGADEPPAGAFWTDRGRAKRAEEPGRFRRARLEAVRDVYARIAGAYAAAAA
jgi:hypothetical protein